MYIGLLLIIKDRPLIDREKRADRFHHISDKENNGGIADTLIAFISVYFIHDANVMDQILKNTDCFSIYA